MGLKKKYHHSGVKPTSRTSMQSSPFVLLSNAKTPAAILGQDFISISRKEWKCF